MSGYYDDPPRWTDARWVWAAIAAVCVVALLGNLAVWLLLRDSADGSPSPNSGRAQQGAMPSGRAGGHHSNSTTPERKAQPESAAVANCRARWQQQRQPMREAQSSLQQWRVHVRAMNELVAGDISLSQATAFCNQTRKGAMQRIMRFEHDIGHYETTAPECGTNALQTADEAPIPMAARDCMRASVSGDRVLAAAKTAIATWQHHVHHMEMLRNGQLTAAQATQMWQMSWRAGQHELVEYGHASMQALYLRCA